MLARPYMSSGAIFKRYSAVYWFDKIHISFLLALYLRFADSAKMSLLPYKRVKCNMSFSTFCRFHKLGVSIKLEKAMDVYTLSVQIMLLSWATIAENRA